MTTFGRIVRPAPHPVVETELSQQEQEEASRPEPHPAFLPFRTRYQRNMVRYLSGFITGAAMVLFILYLVTR